MKRTIMLMATLVSIWITYGQDLDRKYLIYAGGGYSNHQNDGSYRTMDYLSEIKGWKVSLDVYRKLNKFLYVGLGFEYQDRKENTHNLFNNIEDAHKNTFFLNNYIQPERSMMLPSLNFKLYKNINDNFSLGLNIINGYGFMKLKEAYVVTTLVSYPANILTFHSGYANAADKQYYAFTLAPELVYYVFDKFGIFTQVDFFKFDTINKSQFFFKTKTHDVMWSLGLNFEIH